MKIKVTLLAVVLYLSILGVTKDSSLANNSVKAFILGGMVLVLANELSYTD